MRPAREGDTRPWLLLVVYAIALYLPTVQYGFVLDDEVHIVKNSLARTFDPLAIFSQPLYPGNLYRPLLILSFSLNHAITGLAPAAFHLTNVLLYAAVIVSAYALLARLLPRQTALLAAAVFCAMPVHTEVVANIVGRAELLAALFVLCALLVSLPMGKEEEVFTWPRSCVAFVLYVGGLFSKESSLVAILLVALVYSFRHGRKMRLRSLLLICGPYIAGTIVYLVIRCIVFGGTLTGGVQPSPLDNPLVAYPGRYVVPAALSLLGRYIALAILPLELAPDYSFASLLPIWPENTIQDMALLVSALVLILVAAGGLFKPNRYSFGLAWFFLAFAVTANLLFPIGTIFGERLAFLPSLGIALAVAEMLVNLPAVFSRGVPALVLMVFTGETMLQAEHWRDPGALFEYAVRVRPNSARAQVNYSVVLLERGETAEADVAARLAQHIMPAYDHAAYMIGVIYAKRRKIAAAEHWYNRAISLNSDCDDARIGLGRLYYNTGRIEEARAAFERVLSVHPWNIEASIGLFAVCTSRPDEHAAECAERRAFLERAASEDPEYIGIKATAPGGGQSSAGKSQ